MQDHSYFIQRLQYEFPDAPQGLICDVILEGFCDLVEISPQERSVDVSDQIQAGCPDFHLPEREGERILDILSVTYCGCCIERIDPKCNPCPHGYERVAESSVRLYPTPKGANETVEVCYSVLPTEISAITEEQWRLYGKAVLEMARAVMFRQPNQPYTSERQSERHRARAKGMLRRSDARWQSERPHGEGLTAARGTVWC